MKKLMVTLILVHLRATSPSSWALLGLITASLSSSRPYSVPATPAGVKREICHIILCASGGYSRSGRAQKEGKILQRSKPAMNSLVKPDQARKREGLV